MTDGSSFPRGSQPETRGDPDATDAPPEEAGDVEPDEDT
jgi:hypothetical protein